MINVLEITIIIITILQISANIDWNQKESIYLLVRTTKIVFQENKIFSSTMVIVSE